MEIFGKSLLLIIADILSFITIVLCLVSKVPQIKTLVDLKSAKGISILALYLELFSYTTMMAYNFYSRYAILSYLEYPMLLMQEYVLVFLVFKYNDMLNKNTYIISTTYFLILFLIFTRMIPTFVFTMLVPFCTPIGATSKILQLIEIIRRKDSNSVSLTTWFLSAFTNLTRIYTILVDSADMMLLSNFLISFGLSTSVYIAAYVYKKPKTS